MLRALAIGASNKEIAQELGLISLPFGLMGLEVFVFGDAQVEHVLMLPRIPVWIARRHEQLWWPMTHDFELGRRRGMNKAGSQEAVPEAEVGIVVRERSRYRDQSW